MRREFENELQAARSEVAKAQEALGGSEERVRAEMAIDRHQMELEHQSKMAALQGEMERMREEMTYRAMLMQVRAPAGPLYLPALPGRTPLPLPLSTSG
jgi:hypothetical protein